MSLGWNFFRLRRNDALRILRISHKQVNQHRRAHPTTSKSWLEALMLPRNEILLDEHTQQNSHFLSWFPSFFYCYLIAILENPSNLTPREHAQLSSCSTAGTCMHVGCTKNKQLLSIFIAVYHFKLPQQVRMCPSSGTTVETFDCILQTASKSHALRFQRYHEDSKTRSNVFLDGGAQEVTAMKSHPDIPTNELVLFQSLSVSPLAFKQWLDSSILRFTVMRSFFLHRFEVMESHPLSFCVTSKEDLLERISAAPRPDGPTRLMVFPKSLEKWLGDSLPLDFKLHPVKYNYTLHVVMVRPDFIRCCLRPSEETYFVSSDGPRRVPGQCCKAAGKLAETFMAIGMSNRLADIAFNGNRRAHGVAIDIGAAPGGWTAQLARSFHKVIAIDPASLDDEVSLLRNVIHIRKKTQDSSEDIKKALGNDGAADVICCDANVHPMELYSMIEPVLKFLCSGGIAIVTLKFFGRGSKGKALPAEYFSSGDFENPEMLWLMANTCSERTVVARKR